MTGTSTTISSLNSGTSYQVQVRATNDEGESPWSSPGTGSTNTPVNNAPSFNDSSLTRSVAENTAANTNIGDAIPAATDADTGDTLIYTMEGTDASSFTFDASSRQIKTKQGVTYDHEFKPSYSVTIKVSDGTASDTVGVTINITDVDEPPSAPSAPTVSGALTTSVSVSWSAPSNTGKPAITSYDLQYRAGDSGDWSEGPQNVTGTSTTISSLNSGTSYQVQVRATNDEGESPWSSPGTGSTNTPVNNAPSFNDSSLTRSVAENTAANTNIGDAIPAATDADTGDTLIYTMEGTDASSFTFDASSRQIKTKQGVTYDHEFKPSYSVTIKVSDGTASDTVGVTINITDVDEPPSAPSAPTVSGALTTSVSVSWSAPSNTGKPAITSYDLQYRAGDSGDWSEGPQNVTGTSTTISSLNSGTSYQVQVRATNDEGESPWSSPGTGSTNTPVNNAPSFNDSSLTRSVAENTAANTNIGDAIPAATDADTGDTLIYTMEGTDASSFTFDASSRQIKTKQGVTYDHESKPSYSVTIKVSDGTASDTVGVTINITDVNEPPSKPAAPTVSGASTTSVSVSWSAPTNTGKPDITGYHLRYWAGSTGSWSEGPQNVTGTSTTISSLNSGTSYQVQVRATNAEGESPWSNSGTGSTNTDVLVSLSVSPNPVMEGSSVTVTTVMSEAASSDMMIPLTVTQGSSEADDHGTLSSTMIPVNSVSATGTIATNQDTDSDDETFTVALGALLPLGCVAGSPAKVTVRIVDDDWTNPFPGRPDDPAPSSPSCGESNREDLENFYETTDGDNWLENTNWKSEEPLRQWYGVETDEEENVVSLRLSHNDLSGEIPGKELLCLYHSELKELALWGNEDLLGEVPEELVLAVERAVLRDIAEMLDLNPEWFEDYEEPFDFEDWYEGVTTDDEGRVIELDFAGEEITGEIPKSVFELQRLEEISTGCGITLEIEAPERVSVMMPDDCTEETVSSRDGGCSLGSGDSSVFGLFLVTLLVFAVLGKKRAW